MILNFNESDGGQGLQNSNILKILNKKRYNLRFPASNYILYHIYEP